MRGSAQSWRSSSADVIDVPGPKRTHSSPHGRSLAKRFFASSRARTPASHQLLTATWETWGDWAFRIVCEDGAEPLVWHFLVEEPGNALEVTQCGRGDPALGVWVDLAERDAILALALLATTAAQAATLINGAGATFPYPLYSKWFAEYQKHAPEVQIN